MKVTDEQVAALRAQLSGRVEENLQLLDQLDEPEDRAGYNALVAAGFCNAVERRFGTDATSADVMEFVASVRQQSEGLAARVDPQAAERVIRAVYTYENIDDVDPTARDNAFVILLPAMVFDMRLDGGELEQFLAGTRKLADEWLS